MNALRLTLAAFACSLPLLAAAQWQWVDNTGRKVFSDQPPPADVPASRILRQPGGRPAPAAEAAAAAAAAVPAPQAGAPALSGKDKELEAKKKQADAAEAEKRKAEEARIAAARSDNCARARQAKTAFDSGLRIARNNAQGEREFLDDKQRETEARRLDTIIARDCK